MGPLLEVSAGLFLSEFQAYSTSQGSSVLKLLHISFHLIESWEYSSQTLTITNSLMVRNSNQISEKLSNHKVGINLLIKVETYLTVAKCRKSLEANCTL